MVRSLSNAPLVLAACAVSACAVSACGGPTESEPPGSVQLGPIGGFDVEVEGGARLVIASAGGRVLLDGLPPGDVPADGPPLVGFAVRDVSLAYEMQFGAFKPDETPNGPWRVASNVVGLPDPSAPVVELRDGAGKKLATMSLASPEGGQLVLDIKPGDGPERRFSMGFKCDADDHFAGFGSQTADVDHRGQTVPTFVQEQGIGKDDNDVYSGAWFLKGRRHSSHIPIPEYLSRRGYILAAETDREAWFALCSESETAARVEVEMPARIHLFNGPSPFEAIQRATGQFGRPRMPPRVAFAPWNDAIFGSDHVRAVAQKLRDKKVPSSVIWTEDWKGGEWVGDNYKLSEEWKVDSTLYPDFAQLAGDLHALGFDFHVYFNPFVYKDSSAWAETADAGLLIKKQDGTPYLFQGAKFTDSSLIDLDNPKGREWVVQKMRDAILLGADGWMNDFGEWLPTDSVTAAGSGMDRHNEYPVLWQKAAREAIDGMPDGKERLFLGRSGWLGTPGLADVIWAGDQRTDMEPDDGLPTILPIGIGLGVVGVSTYGHDIGGYQSATNAVTNKETFFRWTSLGAWSPVMRTHHGTKPFNADTNPPMNPDQWTWDKDDETIEHFRKYAALHISLVPVWQVLAKVASTTGVPIWRGLFMAFPGDATVWSIKDEVMIGDNLLVAPVMVPGATGRSVYLPAGRWYPWDGGAPILGPKTIDVNASLGQIPVFALEGAVIPTYPDGVMTLAKGSPGVPDASSVGDDRVIYFFLGNFGKLVETEELTYSLSQHKPLSGALTYQELNGVTLLPCAAPPVAPCVESAADRDTLHLVGAIDIFADDASGNNALLKADGGAATRKLTFIVRH